MILSNDSKKMRLFIPAVHIIKMLINKRTSKHEITVNEYNLCLRIEINNHNAKIDNFGNLRSLDTGIAFEFFPWVLSEHFGSNILFSRWFSDL